jgi:prepilin-type N-terminal cleavage/methylation domain-containing protein
MRVLLLNSAVMTKEGEYKAKKISFEEFKRELKRAIEAGTLESYIGYQETAEVLAEATQVKIPVNRGMANIQDGDVMLVAKLTRRVNPTDKGNVKPSIEDFEFMKVEYKAPSKREKGFTLVELLVVIVIISILVGVSIPIYKNYIRDAKRVRIAEEVQQCYTMWSLGEVDGEYCRILKNTDSPAGIKFQKFGDCYKILNSARHPQDNKVQFGQELFEVIATCEDGRVWFNVRDVK